VRRHFLLGGVALEDLSPASLAVWLDGCWMLCRLVGLLVRSLVFFLLLFCFFLLPRYEVWGLNAPL
jgi:hypothetical protein